MSSTFYCNNCPQGKRLTRIVVSLVMLFACLVVSPFAGAVEIYKWVDKSGKVHYGDRPDATTGSKKLEIDTAIPPPDPDQTTREDRSRKLLQDIEQDRSDHEAKAAAKRAEEAKRKRNCAVAQQRLSEYEHAALLYDLDKNGQRHVLSDAEHAKALAKCRKDVDTWCRPTDDSR